MTPLRHREQRDIRKLEPTRIAFPRKRSVEQDFPRGIRIVVAFDNDPIRPPADVTDRAPQLHRPQPGGTMKNAEAMRADAGHGKPRLGLGRVSPVGVGERLRGQWIHKRIMRQNSPSYTRKLLDETSMFPGTSPKSRLRSALILRYSAWPSQNSRFPPASCVLQ